MAWEGTPDMFGKQALLCRAAVPLERAAKDEGEEMQWAQGSCGQLLEPRGHWLSRSEAISCSWLEEVALCL